MKKKLISGAIAALVIGGCISAAPVVASSADPVCVTSVTVGSGQILTRCPDSLRGGDRRGVSPGSP